MGKDIYTRILSGKYKGKKLLLPSLKTTRSTKSIIKESFFNTVQFDIIGKNFFEVFGGSGSMGLEALSRGAKKAFFIEKDPKAYSILLQNIESIDKQNSFALLGDSFIEFETVLQMIDKECFFYFDPPFDVREGMKDVYDMVISTIEKIPSDIVILIAIEHASRVKMQDVIGKFCKIKSKKFGKSSLTYYQP